VQQSSCDCYWTVRTANEVVNEFSKTTGRMAATALAPPLEPFSKMLNPSTQRREVTLFFFFFGRLKMTLARL